MRGLNIRMAGKLLCLMYGHKRGKFYGWTEVDGKAIRKQFRCPRCGRTTDYKVKQP